MTFRDLHRRLNDKSFKPFKIRMVNGTVYEIRQPWMVLVGKSSTVIVTQTRKEDKTYEIADDWRTVSISHMIEFSELETGKDGRRKRSA
jgi:hypothetical protein